MTNSTSHFGLEYDSLSDVVSFGVAPGLLLYSWALSGQGTFGVAVMFAYVAMGRSARSIQCDRDHLGRQVFYRSGHPCGGRGGRLDGDFRSLHCPGRLEVKPMAVLIVTLLLSFLMVSTIKYRSFKDLKFRGHSISPIWCGAFLPRASSGLARSYAICHVRGYALLGPVERVVGMLAKLASKPKREQPVSEPKF